MTDTYSLTPHLPTYTNVHIFLSVMDGAPCTSYHNLFKAIWEQRGNPKEQVDWTKPDEWIVNRLSGEEAALAWRFWQRKLNPRYVRGPWYFTNKHNLLVCVGDTLNISEQGQSFLTEPAGQTVAKIDSYEGLLTLLKVVAERSPGKSSDFQDEYASFCRTYTKYQSDTSIKHSQYNRLVNLVDRGYVARSGQTYEITEAGLAYLDTYAALVTGGMASSGDAQSELLKLRNEINARARQQLKDYLATMDPFKFEALIKFLLEQMGYTEVEVTSPTNDKGVDVVANIELGISSVREVVQVKRHAGNISRTVLDQLRGSLHRFDAVRGTIITTGGFSKGAEEAAFERGAAPITLIDGTKLLNLLEENSIGLTEKPIKYVEFDDSKLVQFESIDEIASSEDEAL